MFPLPGKYSLAEEGKSCENGFVSIRDQKNCDIAAEDIATTHTEYRHWVVSSFALSDKHGGHYKTGCIWEDYGGSLLFNEHVSEAPCIPNGCRILCMLDGKLLARSWVTISYLNYIMPISVNRLTTFRQIFF